MKKNALLAFGCLILASFLWLNPASAHHCKGKHANDPGCDGSGSGGQDRIQYAVTVTTDFTMTNPLNPPSVCGLYTGPGSTNFNYTNFPRHLQGYPECWVSFGGNYSLTDDISLVLKTRKGKVVSFQIEGQDWIGEDGIMHKSEVLDINVPLPTDPQAAFSIPINATDLNLWMYSGHLGGKRVEIVGTVSVGTMHFAPCAPDCPTTWPLQTPADAP